MKFAVALLGCVALGVINPLPATAEPALPPVTPLKDCAECPDMVVVPAGSFFMGSAESESGRKGDEGPRHRVALRGFAIGKIEVTQRQWDALMERNPSNFQACGDECPVNRVSWADARQYASMLSQKSGKTYRLPTEAEWEYACRAGESHRYCGSDEASRVTWFQSGDVPWSPQPVACKPPNAWEIHDMSGNVAEWVEDCYRQDCRGVPDDGSAYRDAKCRVSVVCGGAWLNSSERFVRAASRFSNNESGSGIGLGFRLVREHD